MVQSAPTLPMVDLVRGAACNGLGWSPETHWWHPDQFRVGSPPIRLAVRPVPSRNISAMRYKETYIRLSAALSTSRRVHVQASLEGQPRRQHGRDLAHSLLRDGQLDGGPTPLREKRHPRRTGRITSGSGFAATTPVPSSRSGFRRGKGCTYIRGTGLLSRRSMWTRR